jgi:hypothetical protein
MPLVTLTCSSDWYPTAERYSDSRYRDAAVYFGESLPDLIAKDGDKLGLDPGTPADAVQVNYELFHPRAINAPDGIWMKIEFTEVVESGTKRMNIRDELRRRIEGWFSDHLEELELLWPPDFALDIFWGPGHGYFNFGNGTVAHDW